jgi:hypothetical protein
MHRSSLFALAALLCAALALPSVAAAAKTAPQSCTAASNAVVGGKVVGKLTSSNVDPVQAQFATCKHAKKVMQRATELGVEEPRPVRAFYCRPTVSSQDPQAVSYICTFRGADTATFIKLTFKVTYKDSAY